MPYQSTVAKWKGWPGGEGRPNTTLDTGTKSLTSVLYGLTARLRPLLVSNTLCLFHLAYPCSQPVEGRRTAPFSHRSYRYSKIARFHLTFTFHITMLLIRHSPKLADDRGSQGDVATPIIIVGADL